MRKAAKLAQSLLVQPLLALVLMAATMAPATAGQLRVGVVKTDITPADLTALNPMGGITFSSVHDPIFARSLLIADDTNSAAIVSLDLIEAGDMTPLRQRIERELGIPFNNIMIAATHDHNAPRIGDVSPGALAHPGGAESRAYTNWVYDKIIVALKQAQAQARPAQFGLGTGEANVNVNRDAYTLQRGWFMGFNADGPSDKTVWVIKFTDPAGKPIAVLFNYAVHNDVMLGSNVLSGDLSGVAERHVEANLGDGVVALWTLGPAGDQDPRIFPRPGGGGGPLATGGAPPAGGPPGGGGISSATMVLKVQAMEAQGVMVGGEVVRVAGTITKLTGDVKLSADAREVSCPTKQGTNQMADMTAVRVPNVGVRLGLIRLNDVALTSVGGEVVTNIFSRLKRESPLVNTMMLTITNDRIGYIPDDAAYDRPIFEVNGSPAARGCAENAIVDGLIDMIRSSGR